MKKDVIDKSREAKKKTLEKPILFSGKMVKAILENKKFVTRRPVDPQPPDFIDYFRYVETCNYFGAYMQPGEPCAYPSITAKYWPGLKLWVRETFMRMKRPKNCPFPPDNGKNGWWTYGDCDYCYKASMKVYLEDKWCSPLFLPRIASRLLLDVITVTIERLHKLDDIDVAMEGCENREEFIQVWDALNKKRDFPWAANPWVYRIQFKKHDN